jgi:[ribosomal protein S5]-alanine N-acetyltransferase
VRIVTTRLTLRPPARTDIGTILAIHHDPRASLHNPSDLLPDLPAAEDLYTRWSDHWRRHGFGYWVITTPAPAPAPAAVSAPVSVPASAPASVSAAAEATSATEATTEATAAAAGERILGFSGLKVVRFQDREILNLFYRLAPDAWGHGYATEAVTAVVTWAAEHLPHWPIMARIRPENLASQRVALRAGLTRAPDLDAPGEDGPDQMYTLRWSAHPV